jgi:hypothetical protein
VTRIPLLADARIVVVEPGPDDVVLRPPPPREILGDVPQAARDALAYPLAGDPLERLVTRGRSPRRPSAHATLRSPPPQTNWSDSKCET